MHSMGRKIGGSRIVEVIWKEAYGFPDYEVNNYGIVINKHGKLISHKIDKNGYHTVGLSKDGQTYNMHRDW